MSAGIAVETARIETAPKDAPTSLRGLTHTDRHNRSEGSMQPTLTESDLERFWSKVTQTRTCWLWIGGRTSQGYGRFTVRNGGRWRNLAAHRVAYVTLVGEPEAGLVLDHICRVRECVNPSHLRAVDNATNVLAGIGPTAINARKTHCEQGHEFTQENTRFRGEWRECRECHRAKRRRQRSERSDQCAATAIRSGERCQRRSRDGSGFCYLHSMTGQPR